MKFKKKVLTDYCGSSSQSRAIVREVVWGITERISASVEETLEATNTVQLSGAEHFGLPTTFSSASNSKGKRPKAKRESHTPIGLIATLPVPKYNGTLLEDHVYEVAKGSHIHGITVRVYGIHSISADQELMCVQIIGPSTLCTGRFEIVHRKHFRSLQPEQRAPAHQLVQQDEQRILQQGMPKGVHLKYWDQRYRILSRYDRGVKLDPESWFSITPEGVAKHVTASCIGRARALSCRMEKILDCFSGCGGNTIPFAAQGRQVVSVDLDQVKLDFLRHNCGVYEVGDGLVRAVCAEVYALLTAQLPDEKLAALRDAYLSSLQHEDGTGDTSAEMASAQNRKWSAKSACVLQGAHRAAAGDEGADAIADVDPDEKNKESEVFSTSDRTSAGGNDTSTTSGDGNGGESDVQAAFEFPGADSSSIAPADLLACCDPDLLILSPPWGGPDYLNAEQYCLYTMLPSGCGLYLTMLAAAVCPNLLLLLPVNTSVQQVAYIAGMVHQPYVIEYVQVNHTPKLMAVYMGAMVNHAGRSQKRAQEGPGPQASSTKHQRFE